MCDVISCSMARLSAWTQNFHFDRDGARVGLPVKTKCLLPRPILACRSASCNGFDLVLQIRQIKGWLPHGFNLDFEIKLKQITLSST
jgi:hypothetical protein